MKTYQLILFIILLFSCSHGNIDSKESSDLLNDSEIEEYENSLVEVSQFSDSSYHTKYHNIDLKNIDTNDYLIRVTANNHQYEWGVPFAYTNKYGDTIISMGKYEISDTDTIKTFALIINDTLPWIGIDRFENLLFQVFKYEDSPDMLNEGLFRVIRNGKIGYANKLGQIIIPCQYDCAWPFKNGRAKVATNCSTFKDYEHHIWKSQDWFYIDKNGTKVE